MKTNKAKSWETISEGIITASEITCIQKFKQPISLPLTDLHGTKTASVQIAPVRGPAFNVLNQGTCVSKKPYKYLSCAVRRAVKEYKALLRTNQWRMLTK